MQLLLQVRLCLIKKQFFLTALWNVEQVLRCLQQINWSRETWLAFPFVKFLYVQNFFVIKNLVTPDYTPNTPWIQCLMSNFKLPCNSINSIPLHGIIGVHTSPLKILSSPLIPKLHIPLNLSGRTFSYLGPPYQYMCRTPTLACFEAI